MERTQNHFRAWRCDTAEPDQEEFNPIAWKLAQAHRLMKVSEAGKYPTRTMPAEEPGLDPPNVVKALKR